MSTIFDLEQTSYWLLLIWIFGAGFLLYKMPKKAEMVCGRVQMRWYWSTALLLTLPYILWAAYRTGGADTSLYAAAFRTAPATLSAIPGIFASAQKDICLKVIKGADHRFKNAGELEKIIELTQEFIGI